MMDYISEIIAGVFGLLVVLLEMRSNKDRKRTEKRAQQRAKESKLSMQMQDANISLSLATATAVESGHPNGELKAAKQTAAAAQAEYRDFLMDIAAEQTTKI